MEFIVIRTMNLCTNMSTFYCFTRTVNSWWYRSIYLIIFVAPLSVIKPSIPLLSYVELIVVVNQSHCWHTTRLIVAPACGRARVQSATTQGPGRSPGDLAGAWTSEVTAKAVQASSARGQGCLTGIVLTNLIDIVAFCLRTDQAQVFSIVHVRVQRYENIDDTAICWYEHTFVQVNAFFFSSDLFA